MQHKSIKSVGSYEFACKKLWLRNQNAQPKIPFTTENLETFCLSDTRLVKYQTGCLDYQAASYI